MDFKSYRKADSNQNAAQEDAQAFVNAHAGADEDTLYSELMRRAMAGKQEGSLDVDALESQLSAVRGSLSPQQQQKLDALLENLRRI